MYLQAYLIEPTIFEKTIVFASDDDLWRVDIMGGPAIRLTTSKGRSHTPHFSPDGKNIAYLSNDSGEQDVYLINAEGGIPQRLTYVGDAHISGWKDNGTLIIGSAKGNFHPRHRCLFELKLNDLELQQLPYGPANQVQYGPHKQVLLGRNTGDPARWKRYKGGTAGTLWVDPKGDGHFHQILQHLTSNLASPRWIGDTIYFISDHEGIGNIYSCSADGKQLKRLTHHEEYYVRNLKSDGKSLVYQSGADIFRLDLSSLDIHYVPIIVNSNYTQSTERFEPAYRMLQYVDLAADGNHIAVITRGQLFTVSPWTGGPLRLGEGRPTRYKCPTWLATKVQSKSNGHINGHGKRKPEASEASPDHALEAQKTLLAVAQDDENEETIYLFDLATFKSRPILKQFQWGKIIQVAASPKQAKIAITNHRNELWLVDVEHGQVEQVDVSEADWIHHVTWSPDGRYIAYQFASMRDKRGIKVYDLKTKTQRFLINPIINDSSPTFDPSGQYLYFIGIREFHPAPNETHFDMGFPCASRPYVVALNKKAPHPFDRFQQAQGDYDEGVEKNSDKVHCQIDFDGIENRIHPLPLNLGGYHQLYSCKGNLFYLRENLEGVNPLYERQNKSLDLYWYNYKSGKSELFQREITFIAFAAQKRQVLMETDGDLRLVPTDIKPSDGDDYNKLDGWVDINRIRLKINPKQEWSQMYKEAWVLQREHFWNQAMSQVDWEYIYLKYLPLLDKVNTRYEFSDLIWEMQGELGTSHCYELQGDYHKRPHYHPVGKLGAEFKYIPSRKRYLITKIYRGDAWIHEANSPLLGTGVELKEGDFICAVDGEFFHGPLDLYRMLESKSGRSISLVVQRYQSSQLEHVNIKAMHSEQWVLYRQWVERNKEYVHKHSQGKLGYVHIPNMSFWGFAEFYRHYIVESSRDGLIVDVRYNGGGNISQHLLKVLAQQVLGFDQSRWFRPERYPSYAIAGSMVCLTNEHAGSDGDIFSHCFKLMKLGPLVGKRTWGGVVGIWPRHELNDGTMTSQPEFSFWFKDVGYGVENHGTEPDVEVEITPQDYKENRDRQLDRGIEIALQGLKQHPPLKPNLKRTPSLKLPRLPKDLNNQT